MIQLVDQKLGRGLGASMAAAALGVSPWLSPIGAWLQLTGRATSTSSPAAEWGHILEPVIRGYCAARHGVTFEVPAASEYHRDLPWLRATPDGFWPGRTRRVQVKNVGPRTSWHWGLDSRARSVPPHYRIQDAVEAAVTGVGPCTFAVLFSGSDYAELETDRDADLESTVLESLARFWWHVEHDRAPDVDHAEEWRFYFADRLPKERIVATADPLTVEPLIDRWKDAADRRKLAEIEEAAAKNKILAAAVTAGANRLKSDHGEIVVVQPKGKAPYVKAPTSWGLE